MLVFAKDSVGGRYGCWLKLNLLLLFLLPLFPRPGQHVAEIIAVEILVETLSPGLPKTHQGLHAKLTCQHRRVADFQKHLEWVTQPWHREY